MSEYTTHEGDDGLTEVLSGKRLPKNDIKIGTLGELDEVSAILGVIRSLMKQKEISDFLGEIQNDLRLIMGEIASDFEKNPNLIKIDQSWVTKLDKKIDEYHKLDEQPKGFITPGADFTSAMIDLGRAITRRAERRIVGAFQEKIVQNPAILKYLNRLSTFLYLVEIHEIQQLKRPRQSVNHIG